MRCPRVWLVTTHSGGDGPRPPATMSRALGASSRPARKCSRQARDGRRKAPRWSAERRAPRPSLRRLRKLACVGAPRLSGPGRFVGAPSRRSTPSGFAGGRRNDGAPAPQRIGRVALCPLRPHPEEPAIAGAACVHLAAMRASRRMGGLHGSRRVASRRSSP